MRWREGAAWRVHGTGRRRPPFRGGRGALQWRRQDRRRNRGDSRSVRERPHQRPPFLWHLEPSETSARRHREKRMGDGHPLVGEAGGRRQCFGRPTVQFAQGTTLRSGRRQTRAPPRVVRGARWNEGLGAIANASPWRAGCHATGTRMISAKLPGGSPRASQSHGSCRRQAAHRWRTAPQRRAWECDAHQPPVGGTWASAAGCHCDCGGEGTKGEPPPQHGQTAVRSHSLRCRHVRCDLHRRALPRKTTGAPRHEVSREANDGPLVTRVVVTLGVLGSK